ncbi:MAG TPA: hypothetical protein VMW25_01475 [Clostridia bacterium]|nr:hypothetical protein [Clostridia bacterium]
MKKFLTTFSLLVLFFLAAKSASAVTFDHCCRVDCNKISKRPNVVACYESGDHGIPGQAEKHVGADWVKSFLGGKMLYQFFCGYSDSEGLHREVAIWKVKKDKCPSGWLLYEDPYPEWGDYLVPGADYCIKVITIPCPTCKNPSN